MKIVSLRILANELDNRSIPLEEIGGNLMKRVALWERRGEIRIDEIDGNRIIRQRR